MSQFASLPYKATVSYTHLTLKSCLEQGLLNNYSLRITRNEQQVSKNNATLANEIGRAHV